MIRIPTRHDDFYGLLSAEDIRVPNLGRNGGLVGLGATPEGMSSRKVTGGPEVPGPFMWGHANRRATVIDNHGGSRREYEAATIELPLDTPFTFEGIPGLYVLRAPDPRALDGDHPKVVALTAEDVREYVNRVREDAWQGIKAREAAEVERHEEEMRSLYDEQIELEASMTALGEELDEARGAEEGVVA